MHCNKEKSTTHVIISTLQTNAKGLEFFVLGFFVVSEFANDCTINIHKIL